MSRWIAIPLAVLLVAAIAALSAVDIGSSTLTWDAARASAWLAFAMLWAAVFTGIGVSLKYHPGIAGQVPVLELHRVVSTLALVYTIVHAGTLILDPYLAIDPWQVLVPFAIEYERSAVAAGVLAAWMVAAIVLSTWLAAFIPRPAWRHIHRLAYPAFALGLFHGVFAGTDTEHWPTHLAYSASVAALAGAAFLRFLARDWVAEHRRQAHPPAHPGT